MSQVHHNGNVARVGPQVSLALGGQLVNAVSTLSMIVLVARGVGTRMFGFYLIGVSIVTMLALITSFGATTGLVRMLARYRVVGRPDRLGPALIAAAAPTLVASLGTGLVLYAAAPYIAGVYATDGQQTEAATYLHWFAFAVPLWAVSTVLLCALRGLGAILPYVACENIGRPIAQLLASVVALAAGGGVELVAAAWAVPFAVEAIAATIWFALEWHRHAGGAFVEGWRRALSGEVFREYWSFTAPQAIGGAVQIIASRMDVVLVGALSTAGSAGIYGAASWYLGGAGMILQAIVVGIGPRMTELFTSESYPAARSLYSQSTAAACFLGLPPYAALALFAPIGMAFYGDGFAAGATALLIVASSTCLNLVAGPNLLVLALAGASRWSGTITSIAALLGIAVDLLLIPQFGATGAAIGFAVATVLGNLWPLAILWARYRITPLGAGTLSILIAVSVSIVPAGLLAHLTSTSVGGGAVALLGGSLAVYCVVLWKQRQPVITAFRHSFDRAQT